MQPSEPTDSPVDPKSELLRQLRPILQRVAELQPETRTSEDEALALEDTLSREFSPSGAAVQAIGALIERGVAEGWLCNHGGADARFSRVARPSPETHGFSIDVVRLRGPALRHTHPKGEVTLGFAVDGERPTFEGRASGWIVLGAGTSHIPEVVGGCMNLIYFLPGGAVVWQA